MIQLKLNSFQLKIIALIAMIINHAGEVFWPGFLPTVIIGRLTFPIFAWMIARGYDYSHNLSKYFIRLIIFAIVSQIPFSLLFGGPSIAPTLIFGLLSIYIYDWGTRERKQTLGLSLIAFLCLTAYLLQFQYGIYGVLMILFFYIFKNNPTHILVSQLIILLVRTTYLLYFIPHLYLLILAQMAGLLALPLIYSYNGKQGPRAKYLFYLAYPLHLILLFILKLAI